MTAPMVLKETFLMLSIPGIDIICSACQQRHQLFAAAPNAYCRLPFRSTEQPFSDGRIWSQLSSCHQDAIHANSANLFISYYNFAAGCGTFSLAPITAFVIVMKMTGNHEMEISNAEEQNQSADILAANHTLKCHIGAIR